MIYLLVSLKSAGVMTCVTTLGELILQKLGCRVHGAQELCFFVCFVLLPSCRFGVHVSLAFETSPRCPCESQGMQVRGSALGTRTGIYLVSMLGLSVSISSIKAQKEAR